MNEQTIITTERLVLREWKQEDFPAFAAMNADPVVMEFFPAVLSPGESLNMFSRILEEYRQSGFCLYALERRCDCQWLGMLGLHQATFEADFTPCVEIGWRLKKSAWGQGYASEAAVACLRDGLLRLGIPTIYSFTALPNERSRRVMERIGMVRVGEFDHPALQEGHWLRRHVLYQADAAWLEQPQKAES